MQTNSSNNPFFLLSLTLVLDHNQALKKYIFPPIYNHPAFLMSIIEATFLD